MGDDLSSITFIMNRTIVPFVAAVAKWYSGALVRRRSRVRFPSAAPLVLTQRRGFSSLIYKLSLFVRDTGGCILNVYDFDYTLYGGESGTDFYRFCLKRKLSLIRHWPRQVWGWVGKHILGKDNTWMKQRYYSFFKSIDAPAMAERFWDENISKIRTWFEGMHREDDLVITASPEFLIRPICRRLGISNLIASKVDPATGKTLGPNCRDWEKVERYRAEYGDTPIQNFYSDSYADSPLARMASKAYMVIEGEIRDWDFSATPEKYAERSDHPVEDEP